MPKSRARVASGVSGVCVRLCCVASLVYQFINGCERRAIECTCDAVSLSLCASLSAINDVILSASHSYADFMHWWLEWALIPNDCRRRQRIILWLSRDSSCDWFANRQCSQLWVLLSERSVDSLSNIERTNIRSKGPTNAILETVKPVIARLRSRIR